MEIIKTHCNFKPQYNIKNSIELVNEIWNIQKKIWRKNDLIDNLRQRTPFTDEYFANLLNRFNDEFKKQPHLTKKNVLSHQDSAKVHKCVFAMAKMNELGYESLLYPPYCSYITPSTHFLSPHLEKWLCGKRFGPNEENIAQTDAYFDNFHRYDYMKAVKKLSNVEQSLWTSKRATLRYRSFVLSYTKSHSLLNPSSYFSFLTPLWKIHHSNQLKYRGQFAKVIFTKNWTCTELKKRNDSCLFCSKLKKN